MKKHRIPLILLLLLFTLPVKYTSGSDLNSRDNYLFIEHTLSLCTIISVPPGGENRKTNMAAGGSETALSGIYTVPYSHENFKLPEFEETGKIVFKYINGVHFPDAGKECTSVTTNLNTVNVNDVTGISEKYRYRENYQL